MPLLLCSMPFSPEPLEALHGATVVLAPDGTAWRARLPEAEIAVGRLFAADLPAAGRLRWRQVPFTGVENLPLRELAARGIPVTNIHEQADSMADHAIMLLLALSRGLADCVRSQQDAQWGRPRVGEQLRPADLPPSVAPGRTLLAAGFGAVGRGIAARARASGMRVVALKRHPAPDPACGAVIGPDELLAALPRVDAVANSLPLTDTTRGIFGAAAFAALPPGALYVNVGRGQTEDESSPLAPSGRGSAQLGSSRLAAAARVIRTLATALRSGHLGGAGLDVFATEPLPSAHPLWRVARLGPSSRLATQLRSGRFTAARSRHPDPRAIITPHLGGHQRDRLSRVRALVADNLSRYLRGQPLRNLVDPEAGY